MMKLKPHRDYSVEAASLDAREAIAEQRELRDRFSDGTSVEFQPCSVCSAVDLANVIFNGRWLCHRDYNAARAAGEKVQIPGYVEIMPGLIVAERSVSA